MNLKKNLLMLMKRIKMSELNLGDLLYSLFQVLFVGLKLSGEINWSWFWVLSPTIALLLIFLGMVIHSSMESI